MNGASKFVFEFYLITTKSQSNLGLLLVNKFREKYFALKGYEEILKTISKTYS